jgi:cyanophycin synthetase
VILYEDHYLRGRAEGEIMALFRKGLSAGTRVNEVLEIRGALASVEAALRLTQPGDLLVVQPDVIDETLGFLKGYFATETPGREIEVSEVLEVVPERASGVYAVGVGPEGS